MREVLSKEGSIGSEDEHWIAQARYHFRMEEYWRDRAMIAESELERMKREKKVRKYESRISRCCS